MKPIASPRRARPLDDPSFAAESLALLRMRALVVLGIGTPMYLLFWGLDCVVSPEAKWTFLALRLIGTAVIVPCYALILWSKSAPMVRAATVAGILAIPLSVVFQTFFAGGFGHIYYVFITIPMYVAAILCPWSAVEMLVFLGLIVVPYFVGNGVLLYRGVGSAANAAQAGFFMWVAIVFAYVSVRMSERARYRDFLLRRDLEKANNELRELDRLKTRFFANVSHELRTPLTLILSPVESLLHEDGGPPPRHALETVHTNAIRLLKLVNTLLDFARIDEGKIKLNLDHHDIAEVVRKVVEAASGFAERRRVRLGFEAAAGLPRVWSDLDLMEKVVFNLLSNALKFTPPGGEVALRVWTEDERLWVSCRDTGPGIPLEQLGMIFERFQQVSSQSRASGSGIGLSLARELVRLHKGDIEVSSDVGRGTTFRFWLPIKSPLEGQAIDRRRGERREGDRRRGEGAWALGGETAESGQDRCGGADRRSGDRRAGDRRDEVTYELPRFLFEANEYGDAPATPARRNGSGPAAGRVLVADDHAEMRAYIRSLLEARYDVFEAANGRVALEIARRERPDVILADYMMPEMDGLALLKELRADPATAFVPAIVITARAEISARLSGLRGGANDYLVKPFHPEELRSKVDAFARLRRYEDEIARKSEALAEALEARKRLEAELVQQAKMASLGLLASGIAHEFNNPVNYILNFARPLARGIPGLVKLAAACRSLEGHPPEETTREVSRALAEAGLGPEIERFPAAIDSVIRGAERISAIVKGLLALVRREATPERFDLHAAIREALAMVEATRPQNVSIHLRLEASPSVVGYPGQLCQVVLNLATNAVQAVAPQGNVWISTKDAGNEVEIAVEDDGPGLSEPVRAHLFEPFFTTKKVGEGTGLGLYLVYRIVTELIGGTVQAAPRAGGGTTFVVRAPRSSAPFGAAAAPQAAVVAGNACSRAQVAPGGK